MANSKRLFFSIGALLCFVFCVALAINFIAVNAQNARTSVNQKTSVAAPAISATLTDAFADPDGDGKAQPGGEIAYTAVITNNGDADAVNVNFANTIDANTTLVAGSVKSERDYSPFTVRCTFSTTAGGSGNCNFSSNAYGETKPDNYTIIGGQNTRINVAATNINYDAASGVFAFDASVQNLIGQSFGTIDGATLDAAGVRLFVNRTVVTTGTGTVSAINQDGSANFTAADQPYFQYNQIVEPNQTSAAKNLQFSVPNSVNSFSVDFLVSTKVAAKIVINEIMANPGGNVSDNYGEYIEVFNNGLFPVNVKNFKIGDNTGSTPATPVTIGQDLTIPTNGFLVFGRSADRTQNGNVPIDFVYVSNPTASQFQLSNTADAVRLLSPDNVKIDEVSYTNGSVAAQSNFARELRDPSLDNTLVDGENWTNASAVYDTANNNKGTPRAINTGAPAGAITTVNVLPRFGTNLKPGETRQYRGEARDANGNNVATTFAWSSSNPAIATVDQNGLATAVADGEVTIRATAANGVVGTGFLEVFTPSAAPEYRNHLEFGTPADSDASDDILLNKTQYSLSYSAKHGGPNWVSWNLNRTHFGDAPRTADFSPDEALPAGVYRVTTNDYTGSGFDRGHQVQSEQRTQTAAENAATFLLTNVLPQRNDLNAGPWLDLESHTNRLAKFENKELYNISGGIYSAALSTLKNEGKVEIPISTWKIVVILPRGKGLADVTSANDLQIIAVNMPNVTGIQNQPWTAYRTTVDQIEAATGYDFLSALPDDIETQVEAGQSAFARAGETNSFATALSSAARKFEIQFAPAQTVSGSNANGALTANGNLTATETVSVNLGTLAPGQSAIVTFRVKIADSLPDGIGQIGAQAAVAGDNFTSVVTDDPDTTAPNDATITVVAPPSAASVTISGRVTDVNERGVARVYLTMTDTTNFVRNAVSNPSGYYRFVNVPAGRTYTINARHKRLQFAPRVFTATGNINNLNFVAEP